MRGQHSLSKTEVKRHTVRTDLQQCISPATWLGAAKAMVRTVFLRGGAGTLASAPAPSFCAGSPGFIRPILDGLVLPDRVRLGL